MSKQGRALMRLLHASVMLHAGCVMSHESVMRLLHAARLTPQSRLSHASWLMSHES